MPFVPVVPAQGRGRAVGQRFVGMSVNVDKSNSNCSLAIHFSRAVCEEAGWGANPTRLSVAEGIGTDSGTFMATASNKGYVLSVAPTTTSRAVRITLSRLQHYSADNERSQKMTLCEFSIDKRQGILIQTPDWLEYHEPADGVVKQLIAKVSKR